MPMVKEINVESYARKDSLGGGFRCAALIRYVDGSKDRIETDICKTQNEAWVKLHTDRLNKLVREYSMGVGHFHSNKFKKNYFTNPHILAGRYTPLSQSATA